MDPDVQRRFYILEFSSWSEQFLRYMSAAIIALLGVVTAQSFFSVGGADAQFLVYTFGLLTLTVGAQFLVFWARIGRGFKISGITIFFFPWLALLLLDAFLLSETPWRSRYALCVNLLPVMAFFVTIHVSRSKAARWQLIALTAILTLISALAEFLHPGTTDADRLAGAETLGQSVRRIFSAFENTAAIGAILLLVFFSLAFLVFSGRFKLWTRLFGVYMSGLFLLGIAFTRHAGVYLGFTAGCALAALLLVRSRALRFACFAALIACAAISVGNSNTNVGCLKTVPAGTEARAGAEGAGTRYLLPHAAIEMFKAHPFFGVGNGRFADEFEKYRTPQWQTNPRTAGSLYLHVLAENGLVGLVLFGAPLAVLFALGFSACRKMSWTKDTERAAMRRKMGVLDFGSIPEERITLAGMLCGLLAVGVLFATDYPQNFPGVSIACAVFGGIAGFLLSEERRRMVIYSGPRRHLLLPLAFFVPAVCLFLFLPTFRAESEFQKGETALRPFFINASTGRSLGGNELDFGALKNAETHLHAALRKAPDHGDAWNALSEKIIFDCQRDPENTAKFGALLQKTTARALECSTAVPEFYQTRAIAAMMSGNFSGVEENLARTAEAAPNNAPSLLLNAEILRAFPQGVEEASRILDRVFALLPSSRYVENMRALMTMGKKAAEQSAENAGAETRRSEETVIPEF